MSINLLPIGGKSDNNTVRGVAVSNNGEVKTNKIWDVSVVDILDNEEIRDTTAFPTDKVELNTAGLVSLRIRNRLGVPVSIQLYIDIGDQTFTMYDANGDIFELNIPDTGGHWMIITDNDWYVLNYLSYIKLRIQASSTPTEGTLSIKAVIKK